MKIRVTTDKKRTLPEFTGKIKLTIQGLDQHGQLMSGKQTAKMARVFKGRCGICFQDIVAGQAYDIMGGTNTSNQCLVHYNCYKPTSAPTYEELQNKSKGV